MFILASTQSYYCYLPNEDSTTVHIVHYDLGWLDIGLDFRYILLLYKEMQGLIGGFGSMVISDFSGSFRSEG